ncbi:MAG: bifunctional folylpolyglutamate synthase/ dihydrofolate synthase, partial [Deltaproteobacteria bacterium]|nr:bifunctional folylpolyglutamate synthase/ dihydrofolate synthase [Deltaproteobacteria bacterium]
MHDPGYETFLTRLKVHERIEPAALPRTPEKLLSMRLLLEALGHPERAYRVIHVAGTNGKGLTSAMIAELLRLEGHSVGLYTSPHVLDLRERIQVDGAMVTPGVFSEVGMRVLDLAEPLRAHYTVSYFDLLTAMALEVFRTRQVTWVVLETGLGGRADATNAVDKDCAVLTRIGLDHQAVLGATLREIAWEKLGIARPGVPTILAGQPPELGEWMSAELRRLGSPVVDTAGY